ncbi:hypothetical protein Tco_0514678 [Tanacetum coccineum]
MYPRFLQTILGIETREGARVAAQAVPPPIPETIPETWPEPDQPQDHLSTPPRQQTSDPIAPVFEHGQSLDPNITSFLRAHETDDEPFPSTNMEDKPLGGSFHASPPRSTQAPPAGHTSRGVEDLITLTALSSHKAAIKDVVGKLVKNQSNGVKTQDQEKEGGWSDYNQERRRESKSVEFGCSNCDMAKCTARGSPYYRNWMFHPTGGTLLPVHVYNHHPRDSFQRKGVAKPSSLVLDRTKKAIRMQLNAKAFGNKKVEIPASQRETRQQSPFFLSLMGAYNDDNFDERMGIHESICQESEYHTFTLILACPMKYVKSLTDEQLIAEFEKIRMAVADLKSQELRRTLKRAGEALEPDTSKKQKSTEAPIPSVPDVPQPPVVSSPKSSGTRRKSLGRSRITKPKSILTELD